MIEKEIDDSAEHSGEGDSEGHSASTVSTAHAPATNSQSSEVESNDKVVAAEAEAPPNGGLKAWTQVVGSFFLFFNSWYVLVPPLNPLQSFTTG